MSLSTLNNIFKIKTPWKTFVPSSTFAYWCSNKFLSMWQNSLVNHPLCGRNLRHVALISGNFFPLWLGSVLCVLYFFVPWCECSLLYELLGNDCFAYLGQPEYAKLKSIPSYGGWVLPKRFKVLALSFSSKILGIVPHGYNDSVLQNNSSKLNSHNTISSIFEACIDVL